jgi:thiol-disulfide isomerase/thioredoxin
MSRLILAAIFACTIGALANDDRAAQTMSVLQQIPSEGAMPPLLGATQWLNSAPLATAALRRKVVLVSFWTYTCINWRRSLPYIRAWQRKYGVHGLVVIGVHAPEFGFEANIDNVRREAERMGISYPIAIDNDYAIWRAFDNNYWPALYLIDGRGQIRYHQFGEGDYVRSETIIQTLLAENGGEHIPAGLVSDQGVGAEAAADWADLRSSENYVGYDRSLSFSSPGSLVRNKSKDYSYPARFAMNTWALSGDWIARNDRVTLDSDHGRIAYRFHARDLHLVMGSRSGSVGISFRVLLDGRAPGSAHGSDVDALGNGILREQRMYQLIRQATPVSDRDFEIVFSGAGAEAFAFTFG